VSTVGSILIDFGAATAGYFAGSKAVKDDVGGMPSMFAGIGGTLSGVFAGLGAALSAGALIAGLKDAGEAVVSLARDADKLSVSTEELSHLRFAAQQTGVDAETLSKAMLKLQETVGKAAGASGEGAEKFTDLKLNLKQLANEAPDRQLRDVADAISKIENPSKRAAAEVALFGKAGAELKPFLEQGAAGLDAMSAEADKLGVTVSSVDAESTLRAARAIDKVSAAVTGVGEHIAAALAPYVEDVANKMIAWAETGDHVGKIVGGAIKFLSYSAAGLVSVWDLGKGTLEVLGAAGESAIALLIYAFDGLAKAGSWVWEHVFHGRHLDTSGIDAAAADMGRRANELMKAGQGDIANVFNGSTAAKVFEYFDSVQDKAKQTSEEAVKAHQHVAAAFDADGGGENLKKITEALADLHKQVDTFGMSEGAKKLYELKLLGATSDQLAEANILGLTLDRLKEQAEVTKQLTELKKQAAQAGMDEAGKKVDDLKTAGATDAQIAEAKKYQEQIEATNSAKAEARRLDEEAKKAREDALTPLQKEQSELKELAKLYQTGRLSAQEFASAAAKKDAELHGESHDAQTAATRGSEAAFKLMDDINKRVNGGGDKKEQIAQAQLNAQQKANQILERLAGNTKPKPPQHAPIGIV
jgi:hypothetical protein